MWGYRRMRILLVFSIVLLAGCQFGNVNQGQVIDYRHATGEITLIQDSNYRVPGHPRFDVLPPVRVKAPVDPQEMGPAPEPGKLLRMDEARHTLQIFNPQTRAVENVPYVDAEQAGANTITVHSGRKMMIVTVDDKYLALPPDTWRSGDLVRYYYKDASQALRMMNVSKTKLE
jgi:hypothetical protein